MQVDLARTECNQNNSMMMDHIGHGSASELATRHRRHRHPPRSLLAAVVLLGAQSQGSTSSLCRTAAQNTFVKLISNSLRDAPSVSELCVLCALWTRSRITRVRAMEILILILMATGHCCSTGAVMRSRKMLKKTSCQSDLWLGSFTFTCLQCVRHSEMSPFVRANLESSHFKANSLK